MPQFNKVVTELGRVIKNRGEWTSLASDAKLYTDNVVQYNHSAYIVKSTPQGDAGIVKSTITSPADSNLFEVFAGVGTIDETPAPGSQNVVKSGGVDKELEDYKLRVYGLSALPAYSGAVDTSNKIVSYNQTKYKVVQVNGGETLEIKKGDNTTRLAILKSFDYNPSLPYNLDYATGTDMLITVSGSTVITKVLPSDARYIVFNVQTSSGNDATPSILKVNSIDLLRGLENKTAFSTGENVFDVGIDSEPVQNSDNLIKSSAVFAMNNRLNGDIEDINEDLAIEIEHYALGTDGKYWKTSTLQIGSSSDYLISKAVEIHVGDIVKINSTLDGTGTIGHVLLNSSTLGNSSVVDKIVFSDGKAIITQAMWNAGARYISCSYKKADTQSPSLKTLMHKTMDDVYNDINTINERLQLSFNATDLYTGSSGYWRVDTTPIAYVSANNRQISNLIPVKVDDVIETNSSITGSSTAGHIYSTLSDSPSPTDWTVLDNFVLTDGKTVITQSLWDAGVRAISLSFNLENTPNPSITIHRQANPGEMMEQTDMLQIQNEPIHVVPVSSDEFNVIVPMKNGKYIRYHFLKYYKKWDSLTYEDENSQTQTATNVVSADIWNNDKIFDGKGKYLMQGNTNCIFQVAGEASHVGDGHGCEVSLFTQFIADGKEIDPTNDDVQCRTFRMIWKAEVYESAGNGNTPTTNDPVLDTDGNPIVTAVHLLDAVIDYSGLRYNNSLTIKRDNIKFNRVDGAMLEMDFGDFDRIVVNTTDKTINGIGQDGTVTPIGGSIDLSVQSNNKANIVEMFGQDVFVRQTMKPVRGCSIDNFVIESHFYDDRLKNYFMPVGSVHYTPDAGVPAQTFNSGDVIAVECIREIELS